MKKLFHLLALLLLSTLNPMPRRNRVKAGQRLANGAWLIAFSLLSVSTASAAPLGTAFTYQGRLTDGANPAQGIYDLRFTIYDSASDGGVRGVLTNAATPVTNGLFTVTLDFGSGVFDGTALWLEIAARTNGVSSFTTLNPRQALTAAPFASYAPSAGTAATALSAGTANSMAATNLTGTLPDARLSSNVALLNAGANFAGTVTAGGFVGNGAGLTNVNLKLSDTLGAIGWITNWGRFVAGPTPNVGPFPSTPYAVAVADLNGDGRPDLVSANESGNVLSVLTNTGSGGFVAAFLIPVGSNPSAVVAVDINGDGLPDLVSANRNSQSLSVLTNAGSGTFVLASSPTTGNGPVSIAVADVNGDGRPDLISANSASRSLSVLTNGGAGRFDLASLPDTGNNPQAVVAADVNRDGWPDLINVNHDSASMTVLTNDGSGGFIVCATLAVGAYPGSVAAADVNGDAAVDLISTGFTNGSLRVLTNNGAGGFALAASPVTGAGPSAVIAADVNEDGLVDLVSANATANTLSVLLNDGHGGYVLAASPATGSRPVSVAAADLNGDGHLDLVSADMQADALSVFWNTTASYQARFIGSGAGLTGLNAGELAAGTLPDARLSANIAHLDSSPTFAGPVSAPALNGNGAGVTNVNLMLANSLGAISYVNHWGVFNSGFDMPVSGTASAVATGDFNGDGRADVAVTDVYRDTLTVLTNTGGNGLAVAFTVDAGDYPHKVIAADLNGDGRMDLITANPIINTLTVLTNGGGTMAVASSPSVGHYPNAVAVADLNGDGKPDLISADLDGNTLTILTNRGGGIFGSNATLVVDLDPGAVLALDVNGDARPDLISASLYDNTLSVRTNNGLGGFALASTIPTGRGPGTITSADVNADGKPDLITANFADDTLTVLTNGGGGQFAPAPSPRVGLYPVALVAADVNLDGTPDLITANYVSETLTVLTNSPRGTFDHSSSPGLSYWPSEMATADINGDGRPDMIIAAYTELIVRFNTSEFLACFSGIGASLANLNASAITEGTLEDRLLSANVALLDATQTFTRTNTFTGPLIATNPANRIAGLFTGGGGGLTNLNASQLTAGIVPLALLPDALVTNNESGITLTGVFSGNGAGVSNVSLLTANLNGAFRWITNWGNLIVGSQPAVGAGPAALVVMDVNNDGKMDVISANQNNSSLSVLTNIGSGTFALAGSLSVGPTPLSVTTGDMNGDGWADLVSANFGNHTLSVLTNNRAGGFALAATLTSGSGARSVVAADVNNDGKMDLVCANQYASVLTVLTNAGGTTFAPAPSPGWPAMAVAAADVNRDGWVDLVTANGSEDCLFVWTNNGGQGFTCAFTNYTGASPYAVAVADVNGDGWLDLVSVNNDDASLTVSTNDTHGGFAVACSPRVGLYPSWVAVADISGDGQPDLICASPFIGYSTLTVLTNFGQGRFTNSATIQVGNGTGFVTAADVNADGIMDLISANKNSNTVTIHLNTPRSYTAAFQGEGGDLRDLNASALTAGTVADARLSTNVALLNSSPAFSGTVTAAGFAGSGAALTGLNASNLSSGTLADARLSTNVALLNSSPVFTGSVAAASFNGNGDGVTNVNLRLANSLGAIRWVTNWGRFLPASAPAVGLSPKEVKAADVNGDGRLDLITVNNTAKTLSVLTNAGNGTMTLAATLPLFSFPVALAVADVNHDGWVDLVAADKGNDSLLVFTNAGWGNFVAAPSLLAGTNPDDVLAADINGDGWVDLVTANSSANRLTVQTNDGSGGFVIACSPAVANTPTAVVAADVNGDGRVDLISADSGANRLTVLTNQGGGLFASATWAPTGRQPYVAATADVNGDGWPDLISANRDDANLSVLTNNGAGGFALASSPAVGTRPLAIVAADLNEDGWPDLVTADSSANAISVLTNDGAGGFILTATHAVGNQPRSIAAADLNGDGHLDLAVANDWSSTVSILFNTPATFDGSFAGYGGDLLDLNASHLSAGTVSDARLSANVALLDASQTFSGANAFTNAGNGFTGTFTGNGAGLTNLSADNIASGTLNDARLPGTVAKLGTAQIFGGTNTFTNAGNSFAGTFTGSGTSLNSLNADNIASGTLNDARLPGTVAKLSASQTFSGTNAFTNAANIFIGAFTGNGAGLTNVSVVATNISGTLPDVRLSTNIARLDAGQTFTGANTLTNAANTFAGNGSGLAGLNASQLSAGTVADARLSANVALLNANQTFTATNIFKGVSILTNTASTFAGNGGGLTNLNASQLSAGTVADARLSANVALLNSSPVFTGSVTAGGDLLADRLNIGPGHSLTSVRASIAGGYYNTNEALAAFIGGGEYNIIQTNAVEAVIGGGYRNTIQIDADYATIGGGYTQTIQSNAGYSTISGGYINSIQTNTVGGAIGGGGFNVIEANSMYPVIVGGVQNRIESAGSYATIGGGQKNLIGSNSVYAVISGGYTNTIQADALATIAGGQNNLIGTNSDFATISGGYNNVIQPNTPYASIPGGAYALAGNYGQEVRASGRFAATGDAQSSLYVLRRATTTATPSYLFLDGSSQRMVVPTNSCWAFDILVIARSSTGSSAGYRIQGVINNNAGTTALVGTPTVTVLAEDVAAWDVTVEADDTNDALAVKVTGAASTSIRWVATVRTSEVTY